MALGCAGAKDDVPEVGPVGSVGVAMALQAQTGIFPVRLSGLSDHGAIKRGCRVDLEVSMGSEAGESSATEWMGKCRDSHEFPRDGRLTDCVESAVTPGKPGECVA